MPITDQIDLSEILVTQETGHNCKLAVLGTGMENFLKKWGIAAIPLHKYGGTHELSVRKIAKKYKSAQGEILEITMQQQVAQELGYKADIEAFDDIAKFRDIIIRNLNANTPMAICFAVKLEEPGKGLPVTTYQDNEHCALITKYIAQTDELMITHWGKQWLVSLTKLYDSNYCLPTERTQETYIKSATTTYRYKLPQGDKYKYEHYSAQNKSQNTIIKQSIIPQANTGFKQKLLAIHLFDQNQQLLPSLSNRKKGSAFYKCMQNQLKVQLKNYALNVLEDNQLALSIERMGGICYGLTLYVAIQSTLGIAPDNITTVLSEFLSWDGKKTSITSQQQKQFDRAIEIISNNQLFQSKAYIKSDISGNNHTATDLYNYLQQQCFQDVIQIKSQDVACGSFNFADLSLLLTRKNLTDNHCFIFNHEHVRYVTCLNKQWYCFDANHHTIDGLVKFRQFNINEKDAFIEDIIINFIPVTNFGGCSYTHLREVAIPLSMEINSFKNDRASFTMGYSKILRSLTNNNLHFLQHDGLSIICRKDPTLQTIKTLLQYADKNPQFANQLLILFTKRIMEVEPTLNIVTAFHALCYREHVNSNDLLKQLIELAQQYKQPLLNLAAYNQAQQNLLVFSLLKNILEEKNQQKFILVFEYLHNDLDTKIDWSACVKKLYNKALALSQEDTLTYLNQIGEHYLTQSNNSYGALQYTDSNFTYMPLIILDNTDVNVVHENNIPPISNMKKNQAYIYYNTLNKEWYFFIKDSQGLTDNHPLFWSNYTYMTWCGAPILSTLRDSKFTNLSISDKQAIIKAIKLFVTHYWEHTLPEELTKPVIEQVYFPLGNAIKSNNIKIVQECLTKPFYNKKLGNGSLSTLINSIPTMYYTNFGLFTYLEIALYSAVAKKNTSMFDIIYKFAITQQSVDLQLFLNHAIYLGAIDIIFALLDKDSSLAFSTNQATQVLTLLAKNANTTIDFIDRLINQYKADTKQKVDFSVFRLKNQSSLLHVAAFHGNLSMCQYLLDTKKQHIDAQDDTNQMTALLYAVHQQNKELVALLLKYKPNISLCPNPALGYHALITAAKFNFDIMQMLLDYDPSVIDLADQQDNTTALLIACHFKHEETIQYLIAKGANLKLIQRNDGMSAIHYIIKHGYLSLLQSVSKKYRLKMTHIDQKAGRTLLHFATLSRNLAVLKFLLDTIPKANINQGDNNGNPIINYAIDLGDEDMVDLLIKQKANLRLKNKDAISTLDIAISRKDEYPSILTKIANTIIMDYLAKYANTTNKTQFLAFTTIMQEITTNNGKLTLEQLHAIKSADEQDELLDPDLTNAIPFAELQNLTCFHQVILDSLGYQEYCKQKLYYSNHFSLFYPGVSTLNTNTAENYQLDEYPVFMQILNQVG